jgi:hypothetical protein
LLISFSLRGLAIVLRGLAAEFHRLFQSMIRWGITAFLLCYLHHWLPTLPLIEVRRALHRLASSDSLAVGSEDSLLQLLPELDVNRSEFFGCIEVSFFSKGSLVDLLPE